MTDRATEIRNHLDDLRLGRAIERAATRSVEADAAVQAAAPPKTNQPTGDPK